MVQFDVYRAGSPIISSGPLGFGQSKNVSVPVDGVLNLKLEYTFVTGMGLCSRAGNAMWGDAAVSNGSF